MKSSLIFLSVALTRLRIAAAAGTPNQPTLTLEGAQRAVAPGGIWIFDAVGKHLGTVTAPKPVHNFAWGGTDGKTLYLTARTSLYRLPLLVEGVRP